MGKILLLTERRRKATRAALVKREAVLRAQVRSVVQGYTYAMFCYGPGGLGKSHIIQSELESLVRSGWQHHTAYSTPKGLMIALHEFPEQVHVFEDCEKLYKTDVGSSILRAACGSPKSKERWVVYETANEKMRVNFRGGVIIVSNENVGKGSGPLAAVASRFRPILWDLTAEERISRIMDMADDGWHRGGRSLTPKECREVAAFLVEEMRTGKINVPVDLRTFCEHALPAYAQSKGKNSGVSWRDMIRSKLQGEVGQAEKRGERNARLALIATSIHKEAKLTAREKGNKWKQATGLGLTIFYRHVKASGVRKVQL